MPEGAVLITGGAGYIGSHVVLALRDQGRDVVVLDNLTAGIRAAVPEDVVFFEGDIADMELVSRILAEQNVTDVMHFAASTVVEESVRDPGAYYHNNTTGSLALLTSCVAAGIERFIFSSTAAVYGAPKTTTVHETSPTLPVNPYGSSKLMVERMLSDITGACEMRYVALRYFNVAGADPQMRAGQSTPHATHLIKVTAEAIVGKRPGITVFGTDYSTPDGTCVRDYIHVSDLADAHLLALAHLLDGGGSSMTLNCGYGRGYSVREVLDAAQRVSGTEIVVTDAQRRAGDPPELIADPALIREKLSWSPRYDDLDVILETAINWERKLLDS